MSEDLYTTKQVMDVYMQPVIKQIEQRRVVWSDALAEAFTGERAAREIDPGVWDHTFTPPDFIGTTAHTTQESCGSLTIESIQRLFQSLREEEPEPPFELMSAAEYARRRLPLSHETLAELDGPPRSGILTELRNWIGPFIIQPVGLRPLLAEGTPRFSPLEMHRATVRMRRSARRIMTVHQEHKRARRQYRAAFRRRKRGLA